MKYIVLRIKGTADSSVESTSHYDTIDLAKADFYAEVADAYKAQRPTDAVVLLDSMGNHLLTECYVKPTEPATEETA